MEKLKPRTRFSLLIKHVVRLLGLEGFFRKKELIKQVKAPESIQAKAYKTPLATSPGPEGVTTRHSMENTN